MLARAELAGAVELLEAQADRICELVATRTFFVVEVRLKPRASGAQRGVVHVLDDSEVHIGGRRWDLLAQKDFAHGLAAQRRRGTPRMGVEREQTCLRQQAGTGVPLRK